VWKREDDVAEVSSDNSEKKLDEEACVESEAEVSSEIRPGD
jgi:hypothetical protein